jgi:NhaA family Na+:H+ antiporter
VQRVAGALYRPIERFLRVEASSGIALIATAVFALAWASSPWADSYERLWHTELSIGVGEHVFARDLHFWISDALMVIFFFVVGLEIRRELHEGELADAKRAALPVVGALGGMAAPALVFAAFNAGSANLRGAAIPTATDIAFAVGVLTLLGKRVPAALRVFLLALAVIDDIGAIVVIAVFYSAGLSLPWLGVALAGVGGVLLLQGLGVRTHALYVLPGAVLWAGLYGAGVHPTIGGVILGLMTPVRPWMGEHTLAETAEGTASDLREGAAQGGLDPKDLLAPLGRLRLVARETLSPVVRLQAALHPWVAYAVMPLFALSNAGVRVDGVDLAAPGARSVALGASLGLLLGKPLGIVTACLVTSRLGLVKLPRGMGLRELVVGGCLAGIGFTMAIFIAVLAFPADAHGALDVAKLAVLAGSAASAIVGLVLGRALLPATPPPDIAAITLEQAEQSAEH